MNRTVVSSLAAGAAVVALLGIMGWTPLAAGVSNAASNIAESRPAFSADVAAPAAGTDVDVTLAFAGLPAGVRPDVHLVEPAIGGGFLRRQVVPASSTRVHVPAGLLVEAAPIMVAENERYRAATRFLSPATGSDLRFNFEHVYRVTLSSWSRGSGGGGPVTGVQGSLSRDTEWVVSGARYTVIATPFAGMKFDHWGILDAADRPTVDRNSSTNPSLTLTVTKPLHLLAGFTPR